MFGHSLSRCCGHLNIGGFRQRSNQFRYHRQVQRAVLSAASNVDSVSKIREMAIVNPEERASAAQMLVKLFDGAGLSTPRNQSSAPSSSLDNWDCTNKTERLANEREYICSRSIPCREKRLTLFKQNPFAGYKRSA